MDFLDLSFECYIGAENNRIFNLILEWLICVKDAIILFGPILVIIKISRMIVMEEQGAD